jgi:predicted dehydrogenase
LKALVVGYGSIGARHARLLRELNCSVSVVSRREIDYAPRYPTVAAALAQERPDYVVVANRTSEHAATLHELQAGGFRGPVLVEKPLFDVPGRLPDGVGRNVYVAYNLRFHPALQVLRDRLNGERPVSAHAYVGQYLPTWRPGTDYRASYSAHRSEGGGVLRDLSHELDYLLWLFGGWRTVAAIGGHCSSLQIDTDDVFSVTMVLERCPVVTVNMNYLDRIGQRRIVVNTDAHTLRADFVAGSVELDGVMQHIECDRDRTYRLQHQAMLGGDTRTLSTAEEGAEVVRLVEAIEQANTRRAWVSNKAARTA